MRMQLPIQTSEGTLKTTISNNNLENLKKINRKWQYFQGKTKFCFNGRILYTRFRESLLFYAVLVYIPVQFLLFSIFTAPDLSRRYTVWIPILTTIFFLYTIVSLLTTSCMDPGIIPRAREAEVEVIKEKVRDTMSLGVKVQQTRVPIYINGHKLSLKYCYTCQFYKPPRAGHCAECDNCVDQFDHHCPYIGNCVGKRNYTKFYTFLTFASLLSISASVFSTLHVILVLQESNRIIVLLTRVPVSCWLAISSLITAIPVLGLFSFHTYITCIGITTREQIKNTFKEVGNPFHRGNCWKNYFGRMFDPTTSSYVDGNGLVTPDFLEGLLGKN